MKAMKSAMKSAAVRKTSKNENFTGKIQAFYRDHPEEFKVGAAAALIAFFFTHGLPLWHDDYGHWLNQANNHLGSNLLRLFLPFTTEPQSWGYNDRPLQVVLYKVMHLFFGSWGTGYFFVKSLAFGGLCGMLYHWMGRLGADRFVRLLALAVLALSSNALASMLEHHDFTVYGQILLVGTLMWALPIAERGPASMAVYQKGWAKIPADFKRFVITFFCLTYFGSKLGGDMRMAPIVLGAHLAFFHRERARVLAAPLAISLLATLPFSTYFFKHLPPFIPGAAGYTGLTYTGFSFGRLIEFLGKDLFSLTGGHVSLLGAMGLLITAAAAGYGVYRVYQERLGEPDSRWGFLLTWLGVALLACVIAAPAGDPRLQIRHTLVAMIPATLLLGLIFQAAYKEFGKLPLARAAMVAIVGLQSILHLVHGVEHRRYLGHTMTAVDKLYTKVEKDFPNSQLLLGNGFAFYGFKETAPALKARKELKPGDDVGNYPVGNTFVATWNSSLDPRVTLAYAASGCGSNAFDFIFRCEVSDSALLLKYIGTPAEMAQADQLDKAGNLAAARQVLDTYLQKDPDNHGVGFVAGIYAYRASDINRMEQIYDRLAPYFPWHTAVVYNWGLAKQGAQKFAEAAKLFERAHSMAPQDYAIGYNLADTYYRVGKKSRAIATIDKMLKVYPENEPMKRSRAQWLK